MIIVEDGSGIVGANAYASIEQADAYHQLRANDAWTAATSAQKTAALVRATDYIEAYYRSFTERLNDEQGLQFPTVSSKGFTAINQATIFLALDALAGPLTIKAERGIKATDETLEGVGETATVYDDAPLDDLYPSVTAMLMPYGQYINGSSNYVMFGRIIR